MQRSSDIIIRCDDTFPSILVFLVQLIKNEVRFAKNSLIFLDSIIIIPKMLKNFFNHTIKNRIVNNTTLE